MLELNFTFADKLPSGVPDVAFLKLSKLKSTIDIRLRTLESKIKIKEFTSKIEKEEKTPQHIRANVLFSLSNLST